MSWDSIVFHTDCAEVTAVQSCGVKFGRKARLADHGQSGRKRPCGHRTINVY